MYTNRNTTGPFQMPPAPPPGRLNLSRFALQRTRRFWTIAGDAADAAQTPPPAPAEERRDMHERLVARLRELGISFKHTVHAPTRTSEESARVRGAPLHSGAKAMLLVEKKSGDQAYLVVVSASKKFDWKKIKKLPGGAFKNLRMATEEEVMAWTGCVPGAVPPFGSLFAPRPAQTVMDVSIQEQGSFINFNAGLRTESVQMDVADYLRMEQPMVADVASD